VGVAEDFIAYQHLMQDALRNVVRAALQQASDRAAFLASTTSTSLSARMPPAS
jgi:hypothetical protein